MHIVKRRGCGTFGDYSPLDVVKAKRKGARFAESNDTTWYLIMDTDTQESPVLFNVVSLHDGTPHFLDDNEPIIDFLRQPDFVDNSLDIGQEKYDSFCP
jgi:hypothetical protein